MNCDLTKPFLNDLEKLSDPTTKAEVKRAVLAVKNAMTLRDIPKLRKLKGRKKGIFYRIRVGNYRIGVTIEGDLVTFARCLPRKNIYRDFP